MSKFVINGNEVTKDFWEQSNTGIVVFMSEQRDSKTGHSTRHKAGNNFPGLEEFKDSRVHNIGIGFREEDFKNFIEKQIIKDLEYSNKEIKGSIKNAPYVNPKHIKSEGIKHSEGKTPMELDFDFIKQMAERMSANKSNGKYPKWNWKKDIDIEEIKDAFFRHALEIMEGRYEDDGRKFGHIEAAANNLMIINYLLKKQ